MNDIFSYSWNVFSHNFKYITRLSLPFLLLGVLSYFFSRPIDDKNTLVLYIGLALYLIGFSMYMCALIFFVSQEYQNKLQDVNRNLLNSLFYAPLVIVTLLLANAPIIFVVMLTLKSMALHLLTFPLLLLGIYVSLKSTFAPFHLILEGCRPIAAIQESFRHTKGRVGKIIVILLTYYFLTSIVDTSTHFQTSSELVNILIFFAGVGLTLFLVALQQIAVFKLYVDSCSDT